LWTGVTVFDDKFWKSSFNLEYDAFTVLLDARIA